MIYPCGEWDSICQDKKNRRRLLRLAGKLFPCTKRGGRFREKGVLPCHNAFLDIDRDIAYAVADAGREELQRQWKAKEQKR